jgi:hypothetical protein
VGEFVTDMEKGVMAVPAVVDNVRAVTFGGEGVPT